MLALEKPVWRERTSLIGPEVRASATSEARRYSGTASGKKRLCSLAANFHAQLTNVTKQQQTLPFQTPYRLQRKRFARPFNHEMADLRMIVTKTRLQVNGLVKYNCSTEGNISRRMKEKKNNILGTSIP